jgi:hypothetical protein
MLLVRRSWLVGAALSFSLLHASSYAFADPQSEAKDLFSHGRDLRNNGDCGSAAPLFRRAYEIFPGGLGSLRNLAECEETLGHFASSRRAWLDLRRALITMPNDPKYEGWDKDAEEAANRLKPKVASFVVDVYVKSPEGEILANEKTGVEILVNGESVGTKLVSAPLERDPGTYRIRAQMKDASPVEQTVALSAGDNPHVTIRIERHPGQDNDSEEQKIRTRKIIGIAAMGAGGALLVGGLITFLIRQSALSDLEDQCGAGYENGPCDISLKSTIDRGKLMSTLSPILAGAGVAIAGVGVVIYATAPKPKAQQPAPATGGGGGLTVHPGLGRIDAVWRF